MGPLVPQHLLNTEINLIIATVIGFGFGFILEASGFTNTRKLAGVFYGYDATVVKVFFTAAVTALLGLFFLHYMGWIDITLTYFPKTFWVPTLVGGAIMGLGFIIGGFCPGTSLSAAATGKLDAVVFITGVMIGIFGYIFSYEAIWKNIKMMGKVGENGKVNVANWLGMDEGLFIFLFVVFTLITFFVYQKWQDSWKKKMSEDDINDLGL